MLELLMEYLGYSPQAHSDGLLRKVKKLTTELAEAKKTSQRFEDLLANKNTKTALSQQLTITNHCIYRYKERGKFAGTNEDIRRKIYKMLARNLLVMDSLPDGNYDLDKNLLAVVKDNTAVTCKPRRGFKGHFKN